jgi:hypothetical protein
MPNEYYFWFTQPSPILNNYDWALVWIFAGMVVAAVLLRLTSLLYVKHPIVNKLMAKFRRAFIWIGVLGLIWFSFRYQNVPIFSRRVFAGSILALGIIWIGYAKWYMFFKYLSEKRDFDYLQIKNKYIK